MDPLNENGYILKGTKNKYLYLKVNVKQNLNNIQML